MNKNASYNIKRYQAWQKPVTPWGGADYRQIYSKDVSFYGTPSHGGYRVSGKSLKRIPEQFRQTQFAPLGWYEEDCDWAIVVHFLPELFTDEEREQAEESIRHYQPQVLGNGPAGGE